MEFSGGKIQGGEAYPVTDLRKRGEEVIFFRTQQRIRGRAGRDYPRNFAANQFRANLFPGQPRIFHLLADGHFETLTDQFADVSFRRVVGNSAHGHRDAFLFVARGQRNLQFFGGDDGIVKEELVEIAEAEE